MKKPDNQPDKVCYGYARGSIWKQVLTLENQQQKIAEYKDYVCKEWTLAWGQVFVDPKTHGWQPFGQRPAGGELLKRLRPGDHVIFWDFDRGFRSVRDMNNVVEDWFERDIIVHAIRWRIVSDSEIGKMMIRLMGIFAQMELSQIKERTKTIAAYRKRQGLMVNQEAGYGHKLVHRLEKTDQGVKRRAHREVDPAEVAVIADIVRLRDQEQWTWKQIYFHLFKTVRTRSNRTWSIMRIHRAYHAAQEAPLKELLMQASQAKSS